MDVNAQISSSNKVLKELEKRMKKKDMPGHDYENLKVEYEKKIDELKKRRRELQNKLGG